MWGSYFRLPSKHLPLIASSRAFLFFAKVGETLQLNFQRVTLQIEQKVGTVCHKNVLRPYKRFAINKISC
jgi:hypothetical protein